MCDCGFVLVFAKCRNNHPAQTMTVKGVYFLGDSEHTGPGNSSFFLRMLYLCRFSFLALNGRGIFFIGNATAYKFHYRFIKNDTPRVTAKCIGEDCLLPKLLLRKISWSRKYLKTHTCDSEQGEVIGNDHLLVTITGLNWGMHCFYQRRNDYAVMSVGLSGANHRYIIPSPVMSQGSCKPPQLKRQHCKSPKKWSPFSTILTVVYTRSTWGTNWRLQMRYNALATWQAGEVYSFILHMQLSPLALVAWPRLPSSDPRTAPTTSIAPPRLDEQSETKVALVS
jgi:hypothetical protein